MMKTRMLAMATLYLTAAAAGTSSFTEIEDRSNLPLLNADLAQRQTAKIRLSNGLQALLISDPQADESSAALAVQAGSWDDPDEYPGMAHFCEHMLFMGTKRFPKENEFSSLIADYSGKMNAFTAPDRTVYMFSSGHDGFKSLLDRFARFFIDPLFNPSGISRELHAVDQEFSKNIENDLWREYMIFKETGNPTHPNAKFSTGNSETLGQIPQSALKQWHSKHYFANSMRLVLYSPFPLDQLKIIAAELFSEVPSKKAAPASHGSEIVSANQKGSITYIQPVKQRQTLTLSWEIPRHLALDSSHPAQLFCYALGRGQFYSLDSALRGEGLINQLNANVEELGGIAHRLFQIRMELTDKGIEEWQTAVLRCFQAIQGLKNSSIPSYLFEEMNKSAKLKYQFQPRKNAFSFTMSLAESLLDEDLATFPRSQLVAASFEPQKLIEFSNLLTPENCLFTLIADPSKTRIAPDRREKWMGAGYALKKVSAELLKKWSHAALHPDIRLADPNPFLPSSFEIASTQKNSDTPKKISFDDYGMAYYVRAAQFRSPNAVFSLHILSSQLDSSAKNECMTQLYLDALTDRLHPSLLAASQAGLHASVMTSRNRIHLTIDGFSDKAPLLLQEILKEISSGLVLSESEFANYQSKHLKEYANASLDLPCLQAKELASSLIDSSKATKAEKLTALEKVSYKEFLSFSRSLFKEVYTEALFAGNLTEKDAESAWLDVRHLLGNSPFPKNRHPQTKVLNLSSAGPFVISRTTDASGNAAFLLLDEGVFSFQRRAAQEILSASLKEAFFDTLRTRQKTGYIVQSDHAEIERRLFQFFFVQSNSHEPDELLHRFELFLETALQDLAESIPPARFDTLKQNLIQQIKTRPDRNLKEKSELLDQLAFQHDEDFTWMQKRIDGFETLTYDQFLQEAKSFLTRKNRKRLAILVEGRKQSPFAYTPIEAEHFKENSLYLTRSEIAERAP